MNDFTVLTRQQLLSPIPAQYHAFAYDAMAVVLPIIREEPSQDIGLMSDLQVRPGQTAAA